MSAPWPIRVQLITEAVKQNKRPLSACQRNLIKSNRNVTNEERQDALVDRAIMMAVTMSGIFIVQLGVRVLKAECAPRCDKLTSCHALDGDRERCKSWLGLITMILIIERVIMMRITMSGHCIVKLAVREREAGEVHQRRWETHVFARPWWPSRLFTITSVESL